MKKLLILAALVMMAGSAVARERHERQHPRVQLGVRAGVFSQDMVLSTPMITTDAQLGWNAAFVSRIRIMAVGKGSLSMGLYLQPEIIYSQNGYRMQEMQKVKYSEESIKYQPKGSVVKTSMRDVDVPVLLSFQIAVIRIQAGPVFNVMHKTPTKSGNVDVTSIRPTVGYGVGASVDIWKGLVLDGRFNGNFKKVQNNIKMGDTVYDSVKGSLSSWSVGLSWLF